MCDGHVTPRFGAYQLERSTSLPPYQDDNLTIIGDQNKSLFAFLLSDPKQNARSLLTPVSDPAFQDLSLVTMASLSMVAF